MAFMKALMINNIYISHCEQDEDLAQELSRILWAVDLESFSSLSGKVDALSQAELISFGIRHSDCVVTILTEKGIKSPRVNQEIGLALGTGQLLIALMEKGQELPIMIPHLRPITFSKDNYEHAFGRLIYNLRQLTRLDWLRIKCPYCGEEMTQYITPEEEVEKSLLTGTDLRTMCSYCEKSISLNPNTSCMS